MKRLTFALILLSIFTITASADIIIFKTGSAKEGIIEEETPTTVKLRIREMTVGFSRENIEKIEYATAEENEDLDVKWIEEKELREEERRQRKEAKERFENEQQKKGLTKVGDSWISPAEAEAQRQRIRLQQREAEQAAQAETEQAAPPVEETELPDFVQDMSEEDRREYLISVSQLRISGIRVEPEGLVRSTLRGTITNSGKYDARSVTIGIESRDDAGEIIISEQFIIRNVKSLETKTFNERLPVNSDILKKNLSVKVISAFFR